MWLLGNKVVHNHLSVYLLVSFLPSWLFSFCVSRPSVCVRPFSADKAVRRSCVFTCHIRGWTVGTSLPLDGLVWFAPHIAVYAAFCSSLAQQPPSSVRVTSRTIPILSFFTVAYRLRASITVWRPCVYLSVLFYLPFGKSKSVFPPCSAEPQLFLVLWARKENYLFVNTSIRSVPHRHAA